MIGLNRNSYVTYPKINWPDSVILVRIKLNKKKCNNHIQCDLATTVNDRHLRFSQHAFDCLTTICGSDLNVSVRYLVLKTC